MKDNSGARFRVIAAATSERSRGDSRHNALITPATGRSAGITTCTSRRPQSGAGETPSTNRPPRSSSLLRSANARFNARSTCRQSCCVFRFACRFEDRLPEFASYRASANSNSRFRRSCCFKANSRFAHTRRHSLQRKEVRYDVNSLVEDDGRQPGWPVYLCGAGQGRRHRAVCNRGHGRLR